MTVTPQNGQLLFNQVNDINSSLIGWWPLDDGRALDYSGAQTNGTLVGAPRVTGGIVRDVTGVNGALTDWSDSNFITIPTITVTTNFTISVWVYLTSYGSSTVAPIVFDTGSSANRWYLAASLFTSSSRFGLVKRTVAVYPSTASAPLNMWAHIVAVKSGDTGTNIFYYLNGVAAGTASNVTFTAATGTGTIGNWGEYASINNQFMRGGVDDVRLYNRALSPGEVHALYASTFRPPNLDGPLILPPTNYPITASSGSYSLTGQSATLLRSKSITANNGSYSLTGQTANITKTSAVNYLITALNGSYSLTGQTATLVKGRVLTANNGSYSVTGQTATLVKGRVLTANNGSYSLSGQTATLLRSKLITANNGSYSLSGRTATLSKGRSLTANSGSYLLSGQTATLLRSKSITANNGTYSLSGQSALITKSATSNYDIIALNGTYSLTGQTATLVKGRVLTANNGSYSVTGQTATIARGRVLTANNGSYTLTGQTATLVKGLVLTANSGSYTLAGQPAIILKTKVVSATNGVYNVTGRSANITYSGAPVVIAETPPVALRSLTERRRINGQ